MLSVFPSSWTKKSIKFTNFNISLYQRTFAYTGQSNSFRNWFFSQIGATNPLSVIWTAPFMIGGSVFLTRNFGSSFATKFFFAAMFGTWTFNAAFSPASGVRVNFLRDIIPYEMTNNAKDNSFIMGADSIANCIGYFFFVITDSGGRCLFALLMILPIMGLLCVEDLS